MRVFVMAVLTVIGFVIQSTVFDYIQILGVKPNAIVLIIVSYAMLRGDLEGAFLGFFSGLLIDIFFSDFIGLHALLGMLTGYFCGKPFRNFYRENYLLPLVLVGVSVFCYEFAFYFTSFLFRGKVDFWYYLKNIILPESVYSLMIAIPVYRILYAINLRLEKHEGLTRKLF